MAMTPAQARVINPVLTEVARGYSNQEFVGLKLLKYVPVGQRGGSIIKFGEEQFQLSNTQRAPGGKIGSIDVEYGSDTYSLKQHALSAKVPTEVLEDAAQVPGIDLSSIAVNLVMEKIGLRLEYDQAQLARNPANYAASNKETLSGTAQWSHDSSTPAKDIAEAREIIRGKIGRRPDLLLLGASVFAALQENPSIIDRFKHTGRDIVTEEMLASVFGVKEVVVGGAVYANASGQLVDVWGKDAILAYTPPANLASMGSPSYGYTYRLKGYPIVRQGYFAEGDLSWYYPVIDEHAPVLAGADAGFLFTNAVA